ncbi:prepilin-type N-terminal cleavage/methylation domain-containing protein, partial [bacterium]|nr:prepilin-type N-terminal cleavage/methylation domain-containing protein [bacterium]
MKRKGFTLIELLAVIVILAIIALIATPTILNVIEKARKGATEQSALGYIDAIEKQVAINQVKGENLITDGAHDIPISEVTVKGETPTKGWVTIEKGIVTNYSFVIGKYVVTKDKKVEKGEEPATKPSGTV